MLRNHDSDPSTSLWKKKATALVAAAALSPMAAACSSDAEPSRADKPAQTQSATPEAAPSNKERVNTKTVSISENEMSTLTDYATSAFIEDTKKFLEDDSTVSEFDNGASYRFAVVDTLQAQKGALEHVHAFKSGPDIVGGEPAVWVRIEDFYRAEDQALSTGDKEDPASGKPIFDKYYGFIAKNADVAQVTDPAELLKLLGNGSLALSEFGSTMPKYPGEHKGDNYLHVEFDPEESTMTLEESGVFIVDEEEISDYNDENATALALDIALRRALK